MRIFLVRHGETEWNRLGRFQGRSDIPLNDYGMRQVEAVGRALGRESVTAIYTSPLIRAVQTARAIGAYHPGIDPIETPALIEMDLGAFEGSDFRQWVRQHPDLQKKWRRHPSSVQMPDGENLRAVQSRAVGFLNEITRRPTSREGIVVCSHNFVIVSLLCHVQGVDLDRFREIRQDTAAVNILSMQEGRLRIDEINRRPDAAAAP